MEQATYTTRTEAIEREIIEVINAGDANANDYNVEAIADLVIGDYETDTRSRLTKVTSGAS